MVFRIVWIFALTAALAMMSRDLLSFAGDSSFVDRYDGRLLLACWEHWFRVFSGETAWNNPGFFFPEPNVLGYTDTFLLNSAFYSLFRFAGVTPLVSMNIVLLWYATIGFCGFFCLLRRFGLNRWIGIWASFLFVAGAPIQTSIGTSHIQLLSIWWLPWIILITISALDALNQKKIKRGTVQLAIALSGYAIIALSTFYIAWFFAFVCLVGLSTWAFIFREHVRTGIAWLWSKKVPIVIASIAIIPFLALFLKIYLPAHELSGGRSYGSALATMPEISSLGSMNRYNKFWFGWIHIPVVYPQKAIQHELYYGFPWGFLALFCGVSIFAWKNRTQEKWRIVFWAILTVLVGWFMMLRVGVVSPWYLVWKLLPGADGIRVVFRINMLYYAIALFAVAFTVTNLLNSPSQRIKTATIWIAVLSTPFFWAENFMWPRESRLLPSAENRQIYALKPPPFEASAFFAYRTPPPEFDQETRNRYSVEAQVMAIRASQIIGLPTINGYSGMLPHQWDMQYAAVDTEWYKNLAHWIEHKQIEGPIATLNLDTNQWDPSPFSETSLPEKAKP
ncbi:MAG: hypothetical protein ACPGN3_05510 [Opitutales bacterium]